MAINLMQEATAKKNLERLQEYMKTAEFKGRSEADKREVYVMMFALRASIQAQRGKADSLDKKIDVRNVQSWANHYGKSPEFDAFCKSIGHEKMQSLLGTGHGGAAEDAYIEYMNTVDRLPVTVAPRNMPTAKARIEKLQGDLKNEYFPDSANATRIYAEIFRARRAVGAKRNKKDLLDARIDYNKLGKISPIENTKAFQDFVKLNGAKLKETITKGHGGEAEEMYQTFILNQKHIAGDTPAEYMPTAKERTEAIQNQIKDKQFAALPEEEKLAYYAELMATRNSVNAERNTPATLERKPYAVVVDEYRKFWMTNPTFKEYLKNRPKEALSAATSGHGGALEDKFKDYIKDMTHIPTDVQKVHMPTAKERIEALQNKIKDPKFDQYEDDEKNAIYAELMATREAVGAGRGRKDKELLEQQIDPAKYQAACKKWSAMTSFKNFSSIEAKEIKDAALSGHGGAIGDKFKEYVLDSTFIPEDVPQEFAPDALSRTERLQDKIKEAYNEQDYKKLNHYTKELIATRSAVNSTLGDKSTLKRTINPKRLRADYQMLNGGKAINTFLHGKDPEEIKNLAVSGHGGVLEKEFKNHVIEQTVKLGVIPDGVSTRHRPMPGETLAAMQKQMKNDLQLKSNAWFNDPNNKTETLKKVAAAIYLNNFEAYGKSTIEKNAAMEHDKMQKGVAALMNSQKFQNMVNGMGGAREAAQMTSNNMQGLMNRYRQAQGQLPNLQGEPVQQNNQQMQNQQNQANNQQNQPNNQMNNQPNNQVNQQNQNQGIQV